MKIGVVIPRYGRIGGAEAFAYELCERLASRGEFQIHVFARSWVAGKAPVHFHKIPVVSFPRFLYPLTFALGVRKRIRAEKLDLIHSHERIFEMDLFTFHGIPHAEWIRDVRRKRPSLFDLATARIEKRGIRDSSDAMILPVSDLVREKLRKKYRLPARRLRTVHPGVACGRFESLDRAACRAEIRRRHGFSDTDTIVLFVGMNFEVKRLSLVLEGIARMQASRDPRSRWRALVVGKGNERKYRILARELGIGDRLCFAGVISEIEKYYLASDIFAMPSHFDTFGLAVLEAMAAGLPPVISSQVGAKDVIVSGEEGIVLSAVPTPEEFADALFSLSRPERRLEMGERARVKAWTHDWDAVADTMARIYLDLKKEPVGPGRSSEAMPEPFQTS